MATTYNTAELRRQNRNRVFRYIYSSGRPVTKQDIAQALTLSLPTVGQNLKELQEAELLEFQGTFDSTGGRKPRAIGVASNARFSIGVYLGHQRIHLACINIRAELICSQRIAHPLTNDEEYADFLAQAIDSFIASNGIDTDRLLGVGIAVCGVPEEESGIATLSPVQPVTELDLKRIAGKIPYPVHFENDANAGGLATWWSNPEKRNMVFLFLHRGIGGAMRIGGEGISIDQFFDELQKNNEQYQAIWDQYLNYLAIAINNIHMVLDCQIILGGVLSGYIGPYLYELRDRISKIATFETDGSFCTISSYGYWSTCIGAALNFVSDFMQEI